MASGKGKRNEVKR